MMRWTITYRGVPIAAVEDASPEQLGTIVARPLPAFEAWRAGLPTVWRDPNDADATPQSASRRTAITPDDLELEDERGAMVPTTRLELVVTGPHSAVAFISLDTAAAHVGARVQSRPRDTSDAMPE